MGLERKFANEIEAIHNYCINYFKLPQAIRANGTQKLFDSIQYSISSPGKRFRPLLSVLTAKALDGSLEQVLPFAASVEFIHTYSLIHDDLPCMDDDDVRRGRPSNHKVFGEDFALLAGDGLLTHAFECVAVNYFKQPEVGIALIALLAQASGAMGMIGGQALDICHSHNPLTEQDLDLIHQLKTGRLIQLSVEGAAIACGASDMKLSQLVDFSKNLGLAFQYADDIDDFDPQNPEMTNLANVIGLESLQQKLSEATSACLLALKNFSSSADDLRYLAHFNMERVSS